MTQVSNVVLGRVVGAHGQRGELRVRVLGDGPEQLLRLPRARLGSTTEDSEARSYAVIGARPGRPGEVRMGLEGVEGRDEAKALRGLFVMVDPVDLERLPPGEYYWYEFIGCRVEGDDGRVIGTVREILQTGAHDVLVVESESGESLLLPAAKALLREVDIERRRIVIGLIPGLLDPV